MKNSNAQQLLEQYQTQLDQFFTQYTDANEQLSIWLAEHFAQPQLCHLLEQVLQDERTLQQISERSYQHGNGFLKVVLLNNHYKLRLHIWFAGQSCEENIHDHRWSFSSLILTGQLCSEIWRDQASGPLLQEYEYTAATSQQAAYKTEKGLSSLVCDHIQQNSAGESYVMPKGKLHRIVNPGNHLVASIMCSAPTEQGTTRLIPTHQGIDPNVQPPKVTVMQLRKALQQFLQHLYQEENAYAA